MAVRTRNSADLVREVSNARTRTNLMYLMSHRIRHCVECPRCGTWYIIALSPYCNGSLLVPTVAGSMEEYILYCACGQLPVASRWRWYEVQSCAVSKAAHARGFGTGQEIAFSRRTRSRRR
jgi:uncharacterized protein YbaR (Trm112 family)